MAGKMDRYVKMSLAEKAQTSEAHYGALEAPSPKRPMHPQLSVPHSRGKSHLRKQKSQEHKVPGRSFHKHVSAGGTGHFGPGYGRAKYFGPGGPGYGPPPGKSFHQKSNLRRKSAQRPPFEGYAPPYPDHHVDETGQDATGADGMESAGYGDAAQPIIVIEQHQKGGKDTCLRGCCIVCFCLLILLFAVAVTAFLLLSKNDLVPDILRQKNDSKTTTRMIGTTFAPNSSVTVTTTIKK